MIMRATPLAPALLAALAVAVAACAPPETTRVQGGGSGADIGNRSPVVEMHAGSEIYPDRRCAMRGEECLGPMPRSGMERHIRHSEYVLEHMGRGGALRRVVYLPPPDLAGPDPEAIEPPFPGPGIPGDAPGADEPAPTDPDPDAEPGGRPSG
jgi:hypothetical protein